VYGPEQLQVVAAELGFPPSRERRQHYSNVSGGPAGSPSHVLWKRLRVALLKEEGPIDMSTGP
jgi:hypothetical protein